MLRNIVDLDLSETPENILCRSISLLSEIFLIIGDVLRLLLSWGQDPTNLSKIDRFRGQSIQ